MPAPANGGQLTLGTSNQFTICLPIDWQGPIGSAPFNPEVRDEKAGQEGQ